MMRRTLGRTQKLKMLLSLGLVSLIGAASHAATYSISGGKFKKDGADFVIKGVNIGGENWENDRSTVDDANLVVDTWKFNTIRLNCLVKPGQYTKTTNNDVVSIVNTYTGKGCVVIIDAHDFIGKYYDGASNPTLDELSTWFKAKANQFKNNSAVWFEVCNEPGSKNYPDDLYDNVGTPWQNMNQRIIKDIRDQGANNIIIVSGTSWGGDMGTWDNNNIPDDHSAILSLGDKVLNFGGVSYGNIGFTMHAYDQVATDGSSGYNGEAKSRNYLDRVQAKGYALCVGEYGTWNQGPATVLASQTLHKIVKESKYSTIGRIAWQWHGTDSNDLTDYTKTVEKWGSGWEIDKTDGTKPTNLNVLGDLVWDDNHAGAVSSGGADLVITNVSVQEGSWSVGSTIHFRVTVKNQGTTSTSSNWLGTTFNVGGSYADYAGDNSTLAAGASQTFTSAGWTANGTSLSVYANTDYPGYYTETDKSNNSYSTTLTSGAVMSIEG